MNTKTKKCPFCGEMISKSSHLKKCNPNLPEDESYILMIEITNNCIVEDVVSEYLNGSSLPDIREKYGISYNAMKKLLKINGYTTRTIKDSCNDKRLDKYKKTVKIKYGVDNVSKSDFFKQKKIETFYKKYGVDNIFKTDGFSEYVSKICVEKYGVKRKSNGELISKIRKNFDSKKWEEIHRKTRLTYQKRYENGVLTNKYKSKLEGLIDQTLSNIGIEFKCQKFVNGLSYDFHITNTNFLIEVNGDYWHANPKFYSSGETINYNGGLRLVNEIWSKDLDKCQNALKFNYKVIYLWEWDITQEFKNGNLENFIINKLWED
jgi:G:T-mismatch repair DNA endonuclease (very short patch repair protein)